MEHTNFAEQHHCNTATFSLTDVGAHFHEQRLDVSPLDVSTGWAREDLFQGALMLAPHGQWYHF